MAGEGGGKTTENKIQWLHYSVANLVIFLSDSKDIDVNRINMAGMTALHQVLHDFAWKHRK